jgi:hypothetical protein
MSLRFGMSAPKAENGFLAGRIVSSGPLRRNIQGEIVNIFNAWKMPQFQAGKSSAFPGRRGAVRNKRASCAALRAKKALRLVSRR